MIELIKTGFNLINTPLGNRNLDIRKMREDLHISQAQFSEILGIPQSRLSGIELKKDIPTQTEIAKIIQIADKIATGEIKEKIFKRSIRFINSGIKSTKGIQQDST
jgi:DNA-binding transcriptional regulator YiaG